jgi:hypothetical protein
MSFLDDLKKQADALRASQGVDVATLQARIQETETACQMVFRYWVELSKQLSVIQPETTARFVLDSRAVVEGVHLTHFRPDIRNRSVARRSITDHVSLYWDAHSGRTIDLTKDFVTDIDRLEARLHQAGIPFTPDVLRHPDTQKLIKVNYHFAADIQAQIEVTPAHDTAELTFTLNNVDGLNRWILVFAAQAISVDLLDELSKWLVGRPHQFKSHGRVLEFHEW